MCEIYSFLNTMFLGNFYVRQNFSRPLFFPRLIVTRATLSMSIPCPKALHSNVTFRAGSREFWDSMFTVQYTYTGLHRGHTATDYNTLPSHCNTQQRTCMGLFLSAHSRLLVRKVTGHVCVWLCVAVCCSALQSVVVCCSVRCSEA